ncbi:MAG: RraA family protein [Clostridium sp.]|nr:RraA family protein [Clostridium sp.]
MSEVGNRIYLNIERPAPELVEQFMNLPSSNVGDMMNRLYCMREYIRQINPQPVNMLGTAITVMVPDGDNAFIHKALDLAKPGDILVIDGNGCTTRSLIGEVMFTYAKNCGIAGIVVDGAIRDHDSLAHLDLPVYAKAITPQGPYKNGPGEINVPVSCGGKVVFPGDILVGDPDGICVVRPADAEKILDDVRRKFSGEQEKLKYYHDVGNNTEKHKKIYDAITESLETVVYEG